MILEKDLKVLILQAGAGRPRTEFNADVYKRGLSKHGCWILDLLLLNRSYKRIKHILLYSDEKLEGHLNDLERFLEEYILEIV